MSNQDAVNASSGQAQRLGAPSRLLAGPTWSFVYIFFTNGTPFDAPNRSEPCPLA